MHHRIKNQKDQNEVKIAHLALITSRLVKININQFIVKSINFKHFILQGNMLLSLSCTTLGSPEFQGD